MRNHFDVHHIFIALWILPAALLNAPALAQTSNDSSRITQVAQVISALEEFASDQGSFVIPDSGRNGRGMGWFHFNGTNYVNSIASTLFDLGYLEPPAPKDPLYITVGEYSKFDFLVYRCEDRIAVFSRSDDILPSSADSNWWQNNGCTRYPIDRQNHTYFALSESLASIAESRDTQRVSEVARIVTALEEFASDNGSYRVPGSGKNDNGIGWFHYEGADDYNNSIATTLANLGYLTSPLPRDPMHSSPGQFSKYDFLVYRCLDRIAVFSIADSETPTPADQAWWQSNECTRYPIDRQNHTYFSLSEPVQVAPIAPDLLEYELVFEDNFNGSSLDSEKWDTGLLWGPYFPINNEEQLYVDSLGMHSSFEHSPFEFTGSTLKITATPTDSSLQPPPRPPENSPVWQPRPYSEYRYNGPTEEGPGYQPSEINYLSGIITTYDSLKMTHGYVEMRAKLPPGRGLWPAFWLLTTHYVEDVPEIDVMEFLGQDTDRIYHTYHYFNIEDNWRKISTPSFPTFSSDWTQRFHTFGMAWSPTEIIWYVNGEETRRITRSEYTIPNQAMYILANLAVGGNWPGAPDANTDFPATFEIDYIRAYKRKLSSSLNLADDYQLMFYDNFNGTSLDQNKWNTHFLWGPYLPINNEEQYYVDALGSDSNDITSSNTPFVLNDGVLSITARQADDPNSFPIPERLPGINNSIWNDYAEFQRNINYEPSNYTSGIITSYDSFKFAYGYAEIRAKAPAGDGLWPAFWLLNGYYVNIQPEIDIMEMRGEFPSQIVHSYHRLVDGVMTPSSTTTITPSIDYSQNFHRYGVRWQPGRIDWYINRNLVHTYIGDDVGYQVMYVIANLAVGGDFSNGTPVDIDRFNDNNPVTFDIDYIRVYQEKHKEP